jgi:hypothetical protein
MAAVLTDRSQVRCAHGATAKVVPVNTKVKAQQGNVLVASDVHFVSNCPFMRGTQPSPCFRIQWSGAAAKVKVNNKGVLNNQSIGKCSAADGSPQGFATIVNTQKASAK